MVRVDDGGGMSDEKRDALMDLRVKIGNAVRLEMSYAESLGLSHQEVTGVAAAVASNFIAGSTCLGIEELAGEMRHCLIGLQYHFMERAKIVREARREAEAEAKQRSAEQ